MRTYLFLLTVLFLAVFTSTIHAVTIYVPGDQPTIQAGIDACIDGDTVLVANGTYTGEGNRDIDFGGRAIVVMSENGPEVTIINCEGSYNDNHRGFIFHSGEDSTSVLQGFTITNGYYLLGGGMWNVNYSSPTVINCTFSENSASIGGGMRNSIDSSPTIINCTFIGNSADESGAGMDNISRSNPTVINCTFNGNSADNGGGMYNWESSPMVINCTFSGNSADRGGGMSNYFSNPTISICMFSGNEAWGYGGGMHNAHSSPTVTNCTFSGNSADRGGGMHNYYSDLTVTNCTFSANSSVGGGGMNNDNSSPTFTNCILWGNNPNEINNYDGSNPIVTYCDVHGGYPGEGNISAHPRFADPDYHLQSTSPCIDAGDPSILDACLPPGLGAERSDMGAYGGEENCGWPEDLIELIIDPTGPILIPRGDTFYFSTLIRNNCPNTVEGDFWLNVRLPSSYEILIPSNFLNYANPLSGQIAASDSINLSNELYVPETVPTGGYMLIGRVGIYPNTTMAERWINFLVTE